MMIGTGIGVTMPQRRGGAAPVPASAPFFDTFNGTGTMAGRTGWTVKTSSNFVGWDNNIGVSGGYFQANNTAIGFGVHAVRNTGAGAGPSRAWFKGSNTVSLGDNGFEAHATINSAVSDGSCLTALTLGTASGIMRQSLVAGAQANSGGTSNQLPGTAFVLEWRTVVTAGVPRAKWYVNGRQYAAGTADGVDGVDVNAVLGAGAANGVYGFNTKAGSGNVARMFSAANGSTDAWISLVSTTPVRQRGTTLHLYGDYGGPVGSAAPAQGELVVNFYDNTSDSLLAGNVVVQNVSASAGSWTGKVPEPAFDNFWMELVWNLSSGGTTSYASQNLVMGDHLVIEGQSQIEAFINVYMQGNGGVTGLNATSTYPAYEMDGRSGGAKGILHGGVQDTINGYMANIWQAATSKPLALTYLVLGGSSYATRASEPQASAFAEVFKAMGGRAAMVLLSGGTSSDGDIYGSIIQMADQYDAATGVQNVYGVLPEGNILNTSDSQYDTKRREMWRLTRDFPARFKLLGWRNEVQHARGGTTLDNLHYGNLGDTNYTLGSTLGVDEHARRLALGALYTLGKSTLDLRGPKMTAVSRVNSTTVDVTYDIGHFDGFEIANTAYAGNYTGGHRFATSSAFTTPVVPTNAVVQSVTPGTGGGRGTAVIRFTFGSLPATLYVSGPAGANPFNNASIAAVDLDMHANASTIRGKQTGTSRTVALQPSYGVGGGDVDYLTA